MRAEPKLQRLAHAPYEDAYAADLARPRPSDGKQTVLAVMAADEDLYGIGSRLVRIDRELRRAAIIVPYRDPPRALPRPLEVADNSPHISEVEYGSLVAEATVAGQLAAVMLSDPMQLALASQALIGTSYRVMRFVSRARTRLSDLVARATAAATAASLGGPTESLESPGNNPGPFDSNFTASRLAWTREHPDGTVETIVAENYDSRY